MLDVRPPPPRCDDWCCDKPEGGSDFEPEGWVRVAWEKEFRIWLKRVGFSEVSKRSQMIWEEDACEVSWRSEISLK